MMAERKLFFGDAVKVLGVRAKEHPGHIGMILNAYHNAYRSLVYRFSCECGRVLRSPASQLELLERPEVPGEIVPRVMQAKLDSFLRLVDAPTDYKDATAREHVDSRLARLNWRQRRILIERYGLEDGNSHTLEGAGKLFGISRERVRQIEKDALKKLRTL